MIIIKCDCGACKFFHEERCELHQKPTTEDDWCLYWDAPRGEEEDG